MWHGDHLLPVVGMTLPYPSPDWKLTWERFGPCRHSPTTEGERYVGSGIVSSGYGGSARGGDPRILLIVMTLSVSCVVLPPNRNPDVAPGMSHHDGPIPIQGPPAPGMEPGFRLPLNRRH